ncbi:MAG: hypothetical protein HY784_13030 [Chloroflexi bacterium]|nr:hypothetical protein [Chloroflexota bacterium]
MAQYTSFLVRLWTDHEDGARRYEIRHVQSGRELKLPESAFMVTLWTGVEDAAVRGTLKDVNSGETIQFQSGEGLLDFLASHLALTPAGGNGGLDSLRAALGLGARPRRVTKQA